MSYTTARYRYRYRPEVPEKVKATRHQLRERGTKRAVVTVIERLLFDYVNSRLGNPVPSTWVSFAWRLARTDYAVDPDGDTWNIRRIWEAV